MILEQNPDWLGFEKVIFEQNFPLMMQYCSSTSSSLLRSWTWFWESYFWGGLRDCDKAFFREDSLRSAIGHIVKDVKPMLGSFRSHSFTHTRRQGNYIVHALIRRARLSFSQKVWMKFVPSNIFSFVVVDFSVHWFMKVIGLVWFLQKKSRLTCIYFGLNFIV